MKVDVYQGADGQHYWRLKAKNGRVVATGGEGYKTRTGVLRALWSLQLAAANGQLAQGIARTVSRERAAK